MYTSQSCQFLCISRNVEGRHILNVIIMELNAEMKSCGLDMLTLIKEIEEGGMALIIFIVNVAVNS